MSEQDARAEVFAQMSTIVLRLSSGRKEVAAALGLSFGRIRVLRRVAAKGPLPMRDLVTILQGDAPNLTVAVDELESRGLVVRTPHPDDRRAKLVGATAAGRRAARKANAILAQPPKGFAHLDDDEVAELHRLLSRVIGDETPDF